MRPMQSVGVPTETRKRKSTEDSGSRIWMREVYAKGKFNPKRTCSEESAGQRRNSRIFSMRLKKGSKKSHNSKKLLMTMSRSTKRNE